MNQMHDHDLDLIAALAEGSLEDKAEAERLVATCAECRAEFSAQTRALEGLASFAPLTLGDAERTRLRTAVWEGLDRRAPVVPLRTRRPWWVGAGAVAAGMLALVGVATFLRPVGGGTTNLESATTIVSAALAAAPTTAASALEFQAGEATLDAKRARLESLPGGNATELGRQLRDLLDRLASESPPPAGDLAVSGADEVSPCADQVDGNVLAIVETMLDERPLIVYIRSGEEGRSAQAFDPNTCDAVEVVIPD